MAVFVGMKALRAFYPKISCFSGVYATIPAKERRFSQKKVKPGKNCLKILGWNNNKVWKQSIRNQKFLSIEVKSSTRRERFLLSITQLIMSDVGTHSDCENIFFPKNCSSFAVECNWISQISQNLQRLIFFQENGWAYLKWLDLFK